MAGETAAPNVGLKLTRSEYLRPMLEDGSIMIKPLSFYRRPSCDGGVSDPTEATFILKGDGVPRHAQTGLRNNVLSSMRARESSTQFLIPPDAYLITEFDAYVWCLSETVTVNTLSSFRMQDKSLAYDACVRVTDLRAVAQIIGSRDKRLKAGTCFMRRVRYGDVTYRMNEPAGKPEDRVFQKPISHGETNYAVQDEIRLAFFPPVNEPIVQELPDLTEPFCDRELCRYFEPVDIRELVEAAGST